MSAPFSISNTPELGALRLHLGLTIGGGPQIERDQTEGVLLVDHRVAIDRRENGRTEFSKLVRTITVPFKPDVHV